VLARALVVGLCAVVALVPSAGASVKLRAGPVEVRGVSFSTAAGEFQATRVISRAVGRVTLATDDPSGRRVELRLLRGALSARPLGGGVRSIEIAMRARPDERYLGFGERSNAVDQRGRSVENYVAEGPFEQDERAAVPAFVPAWGFHPRDDATYFPMPWLLSTAGYGVLVDNAETSTFDLRGKRTWSVEVSAPRVRLRLFGGPRPADALRRMTARIGRQPAPPGAFVFGPWYQPRDDERVPYASVAQTYTHYLPCESQRGRRDAERERVARFHQAGLAVTTYFNPMICTTHTRFGRAGTLLRNQAGAPYEFRYSTLESFDVAQFDFTASAGRSLYGALLGEALADGHDGWMEDFGEYTPLDAYDAQGRTGSALHNLYPTQYHCAARTAARRAARFVRSGWTGTAKCAPIVWGGDPSVDWGFDGLRSVVTNGLTMGLSGVSTWGSDIGGFFSLFENRLTPELLIRWIELGAVSGVMRTQANGIRIPDSPRPQVWDPEIASHWRRWAQLRTQLYPYLAAADSEYRRTGLPIMRHLALAYPGDRRAIAQEDEFLFGPSLLAAPVLEPGAKRRRLYLPPGDWVDLWRSARYREGLSLRRARVLRGGRSVTVPAPLDELPLLARAGTLLALLPPDVDTLADYGDRSAATSLDEAAGRRVLIAFPRGASSTRLEDGGVVRSREQAGAWSLSIGSTRRRTWKIEASLATLRHPLRPCALAARGGRLRGWRFDRRTKVLRATFAARRGTLVARGC
jgi:alpha-glucosidase (family GH31 glycosyl hydrolase)